MKTTIGSAYIRHDVNWGTDHIEDIGKWETRRRGGTKNTTDVAPKQPRLNNE